MNKQQDAIDRIWTRFEWAKEEDDLMVDLHDIVEDYPAIGDLAKAVTDFYNATQMIVPSVLAAISDEYAKRIRRIELPKWHGNNSIELTIILQNDCGLFITIKATKYSLCSEIVLDYKTVYRLSTPFDRKTFEHQRPLTVEAILHHHFDLLDVKVKAFSNMIETTFKEEQVA